MADEIVCFTETAFADSCLSKLDLVVRGGATPGETVTRNGRTVVYRPPAPKPPDRCPRCGSESRCHYIHSVCPPRPEFRAACFYDGDYHPWHAAKATPPRDEAREAFEAWLRESRWDILYVGDERERLYAAFFGGRKSVKP